LVLALLDELGRSVSDDVVVDKIEETPRDGFRIYAWSITERGATQFVQTFKEAMAGWDVSVEDVSTFPQQGRYNLPGYAVKFEAVAAAASPAGAVDPSSRSVTPPSATPNPAAPGTQTDSKAKP
jgi:hypothetical protein